MEQPTLTTPSGYRVAFKPFATFGDKRQIQRVFLSAAKVNPAKPDDVAFSADLMFAAQDEALKLLVTQIEIEGTGAPITDPEQILSTVQGWKEADGQAVYDRLNELTADPLPPAERKKKDA